MGSHMKLNDFWLKVELSRMESQIYKAPFENDHKSIQNQGNSMLFTSGAIENLCFKLMLTEDSLSIASRTSCLGSKAL